ncbi:ABC transporter permease [Helicobacter cholecystus]|uniref:ABC transporter permease n=1 Tax=Helicobacter cholecystus TaxID=45498 RepID=UPI0027387DF1|nr:ABC transporter permease [Helicobacter cholecystus]
MKLFSTLKSEGVRLIKNISVLTVCILGPLAYFLLYPTPYENDIVRNQKIIIIDKDNTQLSRNLAFLANSSSEVQVKGYTTSLKEARELLEKGDIFGILYIPKGFEKEAYLQSAPTLAFLANSSYFLIYGSIINGLYQATQELNPQIKIKQQILYGDYALKGSDYALQKDLLLLNSSPLFNPSLGYINYALAAVFVVILHQMLIVGMGIFGASYSYGANTPILSILLSRMILFGLICIALFAFYFGFGFSYYGIHHHASIQDFWLFTLGFIFSILAFGNFFGCIIAKPYQATIIILLSSLPLIFLLGFIWPLEAIPAPIKTFVQFIPVFHGVNALLRLNEMGADFQSIFHYFKNLLILGVFYTLLSYLVIFLRTRCDFSLQNGFFNLFKKPKNS